MKKGKKILALLLAVTLLFACMPSSVAFFFKEDKTCAHEYSFWKVEREATSDHNGAMVLYCADCGQSMGTKNFDLHAHNPGHTETLVEPFCETNGEKGTFCSICGAVYETEVIPALGHSGSSSTTVTGGNIELVLLLDESGSMSSNDRNGIRKDVAKELVDRLGTSDKAAVVAFDDDNRVLSDFTNDKTALKDAIDKVGDYGGTDMYDGLKASFELFGETASASRYIVLLTDGDSYGSFDYETAAAEKNVVIYTVGLGSGVNASELEDIATKTGGKYFFASVAEDLFDIYNEITETIINGGGAWVTTITPTCHTAGEKVLFCSRCGKAVASEAIEPLEHQYSVAIYTNEEAHTGTCMNCGNVVSGFHTWSDWTYNEDNTFVKCGTMSRTCADCHKVQTMKASHTSIICRIFYPLFGTILNFFNKIIPVNSAIMVKGGK